MKNNPLVSVYIPTHNRPKLLSRAIKSVIEQTYKNIELIVSCDGHSSETDQVVKIFQTQYPSIVYTKTMDRKGACETRNRAIMMATGRYITGLDDDDYFLPFRVRQFVDHLSDSKKILFSNYKMINPKGILITEHYKEVSLKQILRFNPIGNQLFCPTKYIQKIGGFDLKLPAWQDFDLWIRLVRTYGTAHGIQNASYVMDTSHSHERISKKNTSIDAAYRLFLQKHPEYGTLSCRRFLSLNKLKYIDSSATIKIWAEAFFTLRPDLLFMIFLRRFDHRLYLKVRQWLIDTIWRRLQNENRQVS